MKDNYTITIDDKNNNSRTLNEQVKKQIAVPYRGGEVKRNSSCFIHVVEGAGVVALEHSKLWQEDKEAIIKEYYRLNPDVPPLESDKEFLN